MKKIFIASVFILFGMVVLESFKPLQTMKKDGAAPGYTGSPGDSLKNCTSCHGGKAVNVNGWITSNIPTSGYTPGQTYTITTTNTEKDGTRFGFEVSPQNLAGDLLGKMIITDSVQTKLVGSDKYITYTANGVDGQGFKSWSFNWIAPIAGKGDVVFYGGYNSNFNGHKSDDKTFLSTLSVKENGTNAISAFSKIIANFSFYPNPANDIISVSFDVKIANNVLLDIIDITGKQVAIIMNEKQNGVVTKQFNTAALPNGNYFVRMQVNGQTATQKLNIMH